MLGQGHIHYSNMTPQEEFRINGTLCEPTIESLLNLHEDLNNSDVAGAIVYIKEARGSYPAEDFLTTTISRLRNLSNRVRGQNKTELLDIIERLQVIESQTYNESEYGSDELRKALDCLKVIE